MPSKRIKWDIGQKWLKTIPKLKSKLFQSVEHHKNGTWEVVIRTALEVLKAFKAHLNAEFPHNESVDDTLPEST